MTILKKKSLTIRFWPRSFGIFKDFGKSGWLWKSSQREQTTSRKIKGYKLFDFQIHLPKNLQNSFSFVQDIEDGQRIFKISEILWNLQGLWRFAKTVQHGTCFCNVSAGFGGCQSDAVPDGSGSGHAVVRLCPWWRKQQHHQLPHRGRAWPLHIHDLLQHRNRSWFQFNKRVFLVTPRSRRDCYIQRLVPFSKRFEMHSAGCCAAFPMWKNTLTWAGFEPMTSFVRTRNRLCHKSRVCRRVSMFIPLMMSD